MRKFQLFVWKDDEWEWRVTVSSVSAVDGLRAAVQACGEAKTLPVRFEEEAPFIDRDQPNN